MRKIRLSDTDGMLFSEEMKACDYDYLMKHKDTFRRMWQEQGKKFWDRYLTVFRSFVVRFTMLGGLASDLSRLQDTLDFAFTILRTNFVEGKANQAKNLLLQIADLGKNQDKLMYLDHKSVSKDPFYTRETRDVFREFFGPANEQSSYARVYLLTPVYMKFGGSIIRCLIKWKDAEETDPTDDSYYCAPVPLELNTAKRNSNKDCPPLSSSLCAFHVEDCEKKFCEQFELGLPFSPVDLPWNKGDPRFNEPSNPLWNLEADSKSDWRDDLTIEKFKEFYAWCNFSGSFCETKSQCPDCNAGRKGKKKGKKKETTPKDHCEAEKEVFAAVHSMSRFSDLLSLDINPKCLNSEIFGKLANDVKIKNKCSGACDYHVSCETVVGSDKCVKKGMSIKNDAESEKVVGRTVVKNKKQTEKVKAGSKASEAEAAETHAGKEKEKMKDSKKSKEKHSTMLSEQSMVTLTVPCTVQEPIKVLVHVQHSCNQQTGAAETIVVVKKVVGGPSPPNVNCDAEGNEHGLWFIRKDISMLTTECLTMVHERLPVRLALEAFAGCIMEINFGSEGREQKKEQAGDGKKKEGKCEDKTTADVPPGHFLVKVEGNDLTLKAFIAHLLAVAMQEKNNSGKGWNLTSSDVLNFLNYLGTEIVLLEDLKISIYVGPAIKEFLLQEKLMPLRTSSKWKPMPTVCVDPKEASQAAMSNDYSFDIDLNDSGLPPTKIVSKSGKALMVSWPKPVDRAVNAAQKANYLPKQLDICSNCNAIESAPGFFKKCKRCCKEGREKCPRYCGNRCQKAHWTSGHSKDHAEEEEPATAKTTTT